MASTPFNSNNVRINPGTLFIPLGNTESAHTSNTPTLERINLLLRSTGHQGINDITDSTVAQNIADAVAVLVNHIATFERYCVTAGHIIDPIHGPGLILTAAHSVVGVSNLISDLLRITVDDGAIPPIISHDNAALRALPANTAGIPWCELIDLHGDRAASTTCVVDLNAQNDWDRVMLIDTHRVINTGLHCAISNAGSNGAPAQTPQTHTAQPAAGSDDADSATADPDSAVFDGAVSDSAVSDDTTASMAGYDELLAVVLRGVAAQIEGTDLSAETDNITAITADRDAMVATLVNAATMLEAGAQHDNEQITQLVIDNLDNITHRMEAAAPINPDLADAVLDDAVLADAVDDSAANAAGNGAVLNAAQLSLAQAAQLAAARISQFTARQRF